MKLENSDSVRNSNINIAGATILGYINLFVSVLSGIVLTPLIIKSIGSSNYGVLTLSSSIISLFIIDFGLTATTNTFLSKLRAKNQYEEMTKFMNTIIKLYLIIDVVIFAIFLSAYFLIDYIYVGLSIDERESLKVCFLIAGLFSLVSFPSTPFTGYIFGNEKFLVNKIAELVNKVAYIVLAIVSITFSLGLYWLVACHVVAGLISIIIRILYVKFGLKFSFSFKNSLPRFRLKEILLFSIWTAIMSIFTRLIFNITPSILGIVSNSFEISLFGVVTTIEIYIYTFSTIMSGLFLPKIARILNEENWKEELKKLAYKIGKIQFLITSLLLFGFVAVGNEFILIWLKDEQYLTAFLCVVLISSYQLINIPQIIYYNALFCIDGCVKKMAIISIIKASFNCALSFLLCYFYGALGASIAICAARIVELILFNVLYTKKLGFCFFDFLWRVIIRNSYIPLLSLAVLIPIYFLLHLGLLQTFLIKGFSFVAVFALFMAIEYRSIIFKRLR